MNEIELPETGVTRSADRLDQVLTLGVWLLVVALIGLGGWFGFSVFKTREAERLASPTGRTMMALMEQIKKHPNDVALRVRIGETYASAGMYDDAMKSFKQALELDPEHSGAYLDMGLVSMATKEWGEAEKYFTRVLELTAGAEYEGLSQRREQSFFYLGQIALDDGRFEETIGFLKEALRIRRSASDTYLYLGRAYHGLDELDAAIDNLLVALRLDPKYPEARYELGRYYLERGDEASAAVSFRMVVDSHPEVDQPVEALEAMGPASDRIKSAKQALEEGDKTKALSDATIAVAVDPKNMEALLLKGTVLEQMGRKADARETYKAALAIDPKNEEASAALKRVSGK
ncbi:MAG: tetratricopeptide repeat protein [Coriobacteriia bacterium]|nr:tetratricopeptide repeat protein [Coriobacteriia bacterium]